MADTTYVSGVTVIEAEWLNDLNRLHYTIFADAADVAAARTALGLAVGSSVIFADFRATSTITAGTAGAGGRVNIGQTSDAADGALNLMNVATAVGRTWLTSGISPTWNFSVAGTTILGLNEGFVDITGYMTITDGVTAPTATAGRAKIFVDTLDGDLKVIFADGTVKVISADT